MHARVGKCEAAKLFDQAVAVSENALRVWRADEIAEAPDDFSSAQPLRGDLLERIPDLGGIGAPASQQPVARLGVACDGGERLIQLVGDARGHLAHGGEARDVSEPLQEGPLLVWR